MEVSKVEKSRKKTGGRVAGQPNKKTAETQAKVAASGLTPLEFMLKQMRRSYPRNATVAQKIAIDGMRFDAARAAAPYVHAKLASIEYTGKDGGPIEVTQITRRIVRS